MEENLISKLAKLICGEKPSNFCMLTASQLVESMKRTCSECLTDRKFVLLDPLCKDRFYLSLLIEAGATSGQYPADCYKIRIEEIKKIVADKPSPVSVEDAVVKLKDFLYALIDGRKLKLAKRRLASIKSRDTLWSFLDEIAELDEKIFVDKRENRAYLTILFKDRSLVNLLDFDKQLAYVNLTNRTVPKKDLEIFVHHIARIYNKKDFEIITTPTANFYLRLRITNTSIVKKVRENLPHLQIQTTKSSTNSILIHIADISKSSVRYLDLIKIFSL